MIKRDMTVPIPGMSLTEKPKSRPYTKPPKMTDPEAVLQMYLQKFDNKEVMDFVETSVDNGMTIKDITTGILRVGAAKGVHSLDVGLLVAPIVHEKVKGIAEVLGMEYDDGFGDKEAAIEAAKHQEMKVKQGVKSALRNPRPAPAPKPMPVEEKPTAPAGLVARRNK